MMILLCNSETLRATMRISLAKKSIVKYCATAAYYLQFGRKDEFSSRNANISFSSL